MKTRIISSFTFFAKAEKSNKKQHFNFHKAFPAEHSVLALRACLPACRLLSHYSGFASMDRIFAMTFVNTV
jgi:hypothetical protein